MTTAKKVDNEKRLNSTVTKDSPKGILISKLDVEAMDSAAAELALEGWDMLVHPQEKAERLFSHFQEAEKAKTAVLVVCNVCGGESDEDLDECCYCGDADDAGDAPVVVEEPKESKAKKAAKEEPVVKSALAGAPEPKAALAVVEGGKGKTVVHKEKDLDAAVKLVHTLKGGAAGAWWDMGKAIAVIYDQNLWRLRSSPEKPQVFRTFEAFCNQELGVQPQTALNAMDAAHRYSREQAVTYGQKKLTLLLKADDSIKDAIQKDIEAGKSKRELEKKVREGNKGKPIKRRDGKVSKRPAATRPANTSKPLAGDRITVATLLDKTVTVKLWKKPDGRISQLADTTDLARAKKIADVPVGRFELPNGVVQYFTFQPNAAGELEVRVKFVREDGKTSEAAAE